jgi:hypothetical protein
VVSEGAETPSTCGLWGFLGQRPSRVCFCSLRNHTSVALYLSHATKTTEKQLLIPEFHTPSSSWRRDDVTPTELQHHVDLSNNTHDVILRIPTTLTQQRKSVLHVCCIWYFYTMPGYHGSIAGLHGSNFFTGYFCSDFANSEFVRWKSLISGMG